MDNQNWWTTPLDDDAGNMILVTGRGDIDKFRDNPKFSIRVEIALPYESRTDGLPTDTAAKTLEAVLDALRDVFAKDPVAVLTGVYTGAGERTMVFYTLSVNIFNKKLNAALAHLPLLPLQIKAENDPGWEEYAEMYELSHTSDD